MSDTENTSHHLPPNIDPFLGPRVVVITKSETGFGFNVRGQVGEGGQLRSINGELYGPMQQISAVLDGGAAQKSGIRKGDKILEVNGINVEGATHKQVVDLIRSGGDTLVLTVISTSHHTFLEDSDASEDTSSSANDYSEIKSLPISILDYHLQEKAKEKFIVYNIYLAGRHLCSKRYREFAALHNQLKQHFQDFNFPKFPSKWPFQLSDQQLDTRRRGLEQYLEKVCSVKVIGESDVMQEFLTLSSTHGEDDVSMKILMPDNSLLTLMIQKNSNTEEVYKMMTKKLSWTSEVAKCFALFEIEENYFYRKLHALELPHSMYIHNYNTYVSTCICLRKFLFSPLLELSFITNPTILSLVYHQALKDLNDGLIQLNKEELQELKRVQELDKKEELIKQLQQRIGYGEVVFPHCACDSRKGGHVIAIVSHECFKLQACSYEGLPESQVIEFSWRDIKNYSTDEEGISFSFEHQKEGKKPRMIRICTSFFAYMKDCFDQIYKERE